MKTPLPPIYRDCQRLLQHTEVVVRRFSRYHALTINLRRLFAHQRWLADYFELHADGSLSRKLPARWQRVAPPGRANHSSPSRRPPMNIAQRTLSACACLLLAASASAQIRFAPSADGTEITDAKTGLVWRRCSEGQSWSGGTCSGSAATYTHEQALVRAQSQAGWRLPNVKELASIADLSRVWPAIDVTAFPGTVTVSPDTMYSWYWTSSPYAGDSGDANYVHFSDGSVGHGNRDNANYVRLVR